MTLIYLIVIIITGVLLSNLIIKNISFMERVSIGVGLGILFYSLTYFVTLSFGYVLTSSLIINVFIFTLVVLIIFNYFFKRLFLPKFIDFAKYKFIFNGEMKILTFVLLILSSLIILITVFWPISEWDALTLYDFRGKVFSESLSFRDIQNLDNFDTFNAGYYFSYPPSTSLIHAAFYILGSNSPQVIYPVMYFALILFFYIHLSARVNRKIAFLITGVLMSINVFVNHASVPYTNLPYTYFYFVSTILLIEYLESGKDNYKLFVSGLFLAGASWIRSVEPFYIVNIFILILYLVTKKKNLISIIIFSSPVLIIRKVWQLIQNEYATKSFLNDVDYNTIIKNLFYTVPSVIVKALDSFVGFIHENIIIYVLLLIVTIYVVKKGIVEIYKSEMWLLLVIYSNLVVILTGTIAIGILIPGRNEIYDSINRFGIFLYPLIIYIAGLSIAKIKILPNEK